MTGQQLRDLEPGDRVRWCGKDPECGTVVANGRTLVVDWCSGQRTEHTHSYPELFTHAPMLVEQAVR